MSRPGKDGVCPEHLLCAQPLARLSHRYSPMQLPTVPSACCLVGEQRQCYLVLTNPNPGTTLKCCHSLVPGPCTNDETTLEPQFPSI